MTNYTATADLDEATAMAYEAIRDATAGLCYVGVTPKIRAAVLPAIEALIDAMGALRTE